MHIYALQKGQKMPSFRTTMNTLWTENELHPLDKINGFGVRPGYYDMMGATALSCGVNFTVETKEGTSVELLLFHRKDENPYAVIPFPKEYRIGCVYSMIVFGLVITEFEYAYRVDGPYDPKKGLIFDKNRILLILMRAPSQASQSGVRTQIPTMSTKPESFRMTLTGASRQCRFFRHLMSLFMRCTSGDSQKMLHQAYVIRVLSMEYARKFHILKTSA